VPFLNFIGSWFDTPLPLFSLIIIANRFNANNRCALLMLLHFSFFFFFPFGGRPHGGLTRGKGRDMRPLFFSSSPPPLFFFVHLSVHRVLKPERDKRLPPPPFFLPLLSFSPLPSPPPFPPPEIDLGKSFCGSRPSLCYDCRRKEHFFLFFLPPFFSPSPFFSTWVEQVIKTASEIDESMEPLFFFFFSLFLPPPFLFFQPRPTRRRLSFLFFFF